MDDCIFCKIAAKKLGTLIFEDEGIAAFKDVNPVGPVHVLIVPKKHISGLNDASGEEALLGRMAVAAIRLAKELGISEGGYRLVMNSGLNGGQSVPHLHMHLLGGRAFGWPPG